MIKVDLDKARTSKDARVFAGRDRGGHWRSEFKLDEIDNGTDAVDVEIPGDVISVNISFFLGMFGKSVRTLGTERFRQRYQFHCNEDLLPLIDLGVEQALKTSSALEY
jgi:hypothetical protein